MTATRWTSADTGPRAVDRAFADTLLRLDPSTDPVVLEAAALASFAVACGDAALDLRQFAVSGMGLSPADAGALDARLRASRWVCCPQRDASADPAVPLVLEHQEGDPELGAAGKPVLGTDDCGHRDQDRPSSLSVSATRSQTTRGFSSANSSDG